MLIAILTALWPFFLLLYITPWFSVIGAFWWRFGFTVRELCFFTVGTAPEKFRFSVYLMLLGFFNPKGVPVKVTLKNRPLCLRCLLDDSSSK